MKTYENWYEENTKELNNSFNEIKKGEGVDFYEYGDYIIDMWEEFDWEQQDAMQEIWIEYEKENVY